MKLLLTIIAVALPILGLLHYIYSHDKFKPEPIRMLFLTFLAGIAGGVLSFFFGRYVGTVDIYTTHPESIVDYVYLTLFEAIPDECLKLLVLCLVIRPNRFFDEFIDGIVYAVCISLGFVFAENVIHLSFITEHWYETSVYRSFFILPGSLACGILMGYFYSRIHFKPSARPVHWLFVLGIPILCHSFCNIVVLLYDRIDGNSFFDGYPLMFCLVGCTLAILYFVHRLIDKQLERDLKRSDTTTPNKRWK